MPKKSVNYLPVALKNIICLLIVGAALFFLPACQPVKVISGNPCLSNSSLQSQRIVDDCACTFLEFRRDSDPQTIDYLLSEAKGLLIIPDQYKAAFMVGIKSGTGVLCAKDVTGFWNGPAFYSLSGVDVGLQGGFSGSTILVFFFDDAGLESVYNGTFNLSAKADLVLGELNGSSFRDTLSARENVLTLTSSSGFLGAMAYSGGALSPRHKLNEEYYGKDLKVREILSTHKYDKPKADVLLNALIGI
ncbi:lipid-binding SYLF domain-containing protein [Maridesulfovibrio bastinii]|uniref:lipid-binding SYLF domain-containing protein n=1 Tax=Maridesulfovibrio bastinii TaxID=47157 RepID=UPI0004296FF5|nr:lipid-binding SYLF domain-containing protein [Maridesulfovibrio bastinii]